VPYSNGNKLCHTDADLYLESEQRVHAFDLQFVDQLLVELILDKWKTLHNNTERELTGMCYQTTPNE